MAQGPAEPWSGPPAGIQPADEVLARRFAPAWLLSTLLHAALLLILGLTIRLPSRAGADVEPDRSGGIVLVKRSEGQREYFDGGEEVADRSASRDVAAQSNAATPLPSAADLPVNLDGVLPSTGTMIGSGDPGGLLPDAGDLTVGVGTSRQIGEAAQTQVFGVQGTGSDFIYVFDRSTSMTGPPLRASKRELIASLQDLGRTHQFQIIFYNHRPKIFHSPGQQPQLYWGNEASKAEAAAFVRNIFADGNTNHMSALSMALKLRPDVIFFLTDADDPQLTDDELARVRRLNAGGSTVINAIQFGYGRYDGEDNFLKRIARQNGGQWVYIDTSRLSD